jgi:hypothetical protein
MRKAIMTSTFGVVMGSHPLYLNSLHGATKHKYDSKLNRTKTHKGHTPSLVFLLWKGPGSYILRPP